MLEFLKTLSDPTRAAIRSVTLSLLEQENKILRRRLKRVGATEEQVKTLVAIIDRAREAAGAKTDEPLEDAVRDVFTKWQDAERENAELQERIDAMTDGTPGRIAALEKELEDVRRVSLDTLSSRDFQIEGFKRREEAMIAALKKVATDATNAIPVRVKTFADEVVGYAERPDPIVDAKVSLPHRVELARSSPDLSHAVPGRDMPAIVKKALDSINAANGHGAGDAFPGTDFP